MRSLWRRRPSGPLLISVVALIVAVSGTAIAADRLVSGDKLIAKRSLSGNRLRKHTITGTQVNLKKLGKVRSARRADQAAIAGFATSATSATNAVNATNAATLQGQPPSAFAAASDTVRTGLVTARAGDTVKVADFGPFTMTLVCSTVGSAVFANIDVSSTEANSLAAGTPLPVAGAPVSVIHTNAATGVFADDDGNVYEFFAPSGKTYEGVVTFGVNFAGHDCFANALIARS